MRSGSVSLTQMTDFNTGTENRLGYYDQASFETCVCVLETVLGEGWGNGNNCHTLESLDV